MTTKKFLISVAKKGYAVIEAYTQEDASEAIETMTDKEFVWEQKPTTENVVETEMDVGNIPVKKLPRFRIL